MHLKNRIACAIIIAFVLSLTGCQSAYYKTMESFGYHKRDILVSNVEKARESQEEASEQFKSALEKFSALTGFHGGDLQEIYERLSDEYDRSEAAAEDVKNRIDAVEQVGNDLFAEWSEELSQYTSKKLRDESRVKLSKTKSRFKRLLSAMRKAEKKLIRFLMCFATRYFSSSTISMPRLLLHLKASLIHLKQISAG